jgi:hypothetical protein
MRDPRVRLFFWWIAPSLIFYLFIHIRQQGHSFTFMPAVLLLTAAAIGQVADWVGERWHRAVYAGLIIGVVSINVLFFLVAPSALWGSSRLLFSAPSWRSIQAQDFYVGERVSAIQAHFVPQRTAVLAGGRSFRYPDYYLRDYQYTSLSHQLGREQKVLGNVDALVLFDAVLLDRVSELTLVHSLSLSGEDTLHYLNCDGGEDIVVSSQRITCQRQE